MGAFATGNFGIMPGYLSERFPTAVRAGGAGFAYHVGAALASVAPSLVGGLVDRGLPLERAMSSCIVVSGAAGDHRDVVGSGDARPHAGR